MTRKDKEEEIYSWETKLDKCPYCNKILNISCLSVKSEKESISNVIYMSKFHLDMCRGDKEKKLSDISIKTVSMDKTASWWRYEKMLSY